MLPSEVVAACVVSPSVDLQASTELILSRRNWLYHKQFVRSLKKRIRLKQKLFPDLYDLSQLPRIRNIREFDEAFTSVANGFLNADDYYYRASSIRVVANIRIPTLIIHAEDDPFIPFEPLRHADVFRKSLHHAGCNRARWTRRVYFSRRQDEDRFWAENRAVEFFRTSHRIRHGL